MLNLKIMSFQKYSTQTDHLMRNIAVAPHFTDPEG